MTGATQIGTDHKNFSYHAAIPHNLYVARRFLLGLWILAVRQTTTSGPDSRRPGLYIWLRFGRTGLAGFCGIPCVIGRAAAVAV